MHFYFASTWVNSWSRKSKLRVRLCAWVRACARACLRASRGREVKSWQSSHENVPVECLHSGSCGFDLRLLTSPHQCRAYHSIYTVCVYACVCARQSDVTPRVRWPRRKPYRKWGQAPRGQQKVKLPVFRQQISTLTTPRQLSVDRSLHLKLSDFF